MTSKNNSPDIHLIFAVLINSLLFVESLKGAIMSDKKREMVNLEKMVKELEDLAINMLEKQETGLRKERRSLSFTSFTIN